jgi:addiction module HigA family antidote
MVIKHSELDSTDFSDIDTGEQISPVHPGEILRIEFLDPLRMSVNALAKALHVPTPRINDVMLGKRAISADTALRLARYFGVSAQFWLNLQIDYDLRIASEAAGAQISSEIEPLPRARRPKPARGPGSHSRAATLAAGTAGSASDAKPGHKV